MNSGNKKIAKWFPPIKYCDKIKVREYSKIGFLFQHWPISSILYPNLCILDSKKKINCIFLKKLEAIIIDKSLHYFYFP